MRDRFTQSLAKQMRRNPTANEAKLWELLRGHRLDGLKFRRQAPIGRYVADFVCYQRRLIIEADGPQHEDMPHMTLLETHGSATRVFSCSAFPTR